jgi:CTP synthase (UTP-ammonia lyase)
MRLFLARWSAIIGNNIRNTKRESMNRTLSIGILGDYDLNKISHPATNDAIYYASKTLSIEANITWVPTLSLLTEMGQEKLAKFDCLWASSGSPYQSMDGMIKGIKIARELDRPFIGTWGGFQHTLLEYARNVAGLKDADHMEENPNTPTPLLILSACPVDNRPQGAPRLWGGLKINIYPGTLAFSIYHISKIEETFTCNYELNSNYRKQLEAAGLRVSGVSQDGGARIIELPDHRFFLATGFVPQLSSKETNPHPLIVAYLKAVAE